jgi:transketolase
MSATKDIRQQFADTMLDVGQQDPQLVVVVGDISHFKLQPFAEACPGRFYNIGILEPTMVTMSAGLARVGFFPVVHTIAPFLIERSFEQLKLDFGYQALPGNIVTVGSAFDYANLGCTHHCYDDFALVKSIPGAQITFPASAPEFDALFRQAYRNEALTIYRIPATPHGYEVAPGEIRFGQAIRVAEGHDLTLVVTGPQLRAALEARSILLERGWMAEVLYIHTVRPLDRESIRHSVAKTRRVLVIEEHQKTGGLGMDVLEEVHPLEGLQFHSLHLPDRFVRDYRSYQEHCAAVDLDTAGIVRAVETHFSPASALATHAP